MQYPAPQPCPLVLACDEAYAMPLATTLRSIADHHRTHAPLEVHVLTGGYSEATRRKVVDSAGRFGNGKLAVIERHHATAVVAAVFQAPQALDQEI